MPDWRDANEVDAFGLELAAIFAGLTGRPQDPVNPLRFLRELETRAAKFLVGRAGNATKGADGHELHRELATEEREHARTGFITEQSASIGLAGVQQVPGTVVRNMIGQMKREEMPFVCGSSRGFMG